MPAGYNLSAYGAMIEDSIRMGAYHEAMKRHVRPGSIVVEIGSGPGVMALIACQLGAAKVYAIETDPSIELARRFANEHGYGDRIVCLQKMSTEVALPELGDVLVSDLRGMLPLLESHIPSICDARRRLVKPGSPQLSQRDRLMVRLARDDAQYAKFDRPWVSNAYGLGLASGRQLVVNAFLPADRTTTVGVTAPQEWAAIDYRVVESPNVSGRVVFQPPVGEKINAIELWFEAEVCDGVTYSTGPDQPDQVYGRALLPLEQPIHVLDGEFITVDLGMNLVNGNYITRWTTAVGREDAQSPRIQFRQSTFQGRIFSAPDLQRLDLAFAPKPVRKTAAARFALQRFDGSTSVEAIAAATRAQFTDVFVDAQEAVEFVRELSKNYCPDS